MPSDCEEVFADLALPRLLEMGGGEHAGQLGIVFLSF